MTTAFTGCAYSFVGADSALPEGVRSVAVEAVYDTSREVLPHEVLWESLQNAVAEDGHLLLKSREQADALIRAHIRSAQVTATGSRKTNRSTNDPKVFDHESPNSPQRFKLLTQAGEIRGKATMATVIEVEVWNLRTRMLMLKRTFPVAETYQAIHADSRGSVTTLANDSLRYIEATDARFKNIARNISRTIVRDLLIR